MTTVAVPDVHPTAMLDFQLKGGTIWFYQAFTRMAGIDNSRCVQFLNDGELWYLYVQRSEDAWKLSISFVADEWAVRRLEDPGLVAMMQKSTGCGDGSYHITPMGCDFHEHQLWLLDFHNSNGEG